MQKKIEKYTKQYYSLWFFTGTISWNMMGLNIFSAGITVWLILEYYRETDEIGTQGQRDSGRRIGERITDTTFWRNEVSWPDIEKSESQL